MLGYVEHLISWYLNEELLYFESNKCFFAQVSDLWRTYSPKPASYILLYNVFYVIVSLHPLHLFPFLRKEYNVS